MNDTERFLSRKPLQSDAIATPDEIAWWIFHNYMVASCDSDKEYSAYLIMRLKPQYTAQFIQYFDAEEIVAHAKEYMKRFERLRKKQQRRRHEKREDFSLTDGQWEQTLEWFGHACAYCGDEGKLTYDHFVPFSKGGAFDQSNVIPACKSCNSSKKDKDAFEWYRNSKHYSAERERVICAFISIQRNVTA